MHSIEGKWGGVLGGVPVQDRGRPVDGAASALHQALSRLARRAVSVQVWALVGLGTGGDWRRARLIRPTVDALACVTEPQAVRRHSASGAIGQYAHMYI